MQVIYAFACLKKCAAIVNLEFGLAKNISTAIVQACDEILEKKWENEFPLVVWQTGSGTQTNMNVNEVIANRATQLLGGKIEERLVHPNDHVNMGQSSNDAYPTAMHIATLLSTHQYLLPSLSVLLGSLQRKQEQFKGIIKIGRTHT